MDDRLDFELLEVDFQNGDDENGGKNPATVCHIYVFGSINDTVVGYEQFIFMPHSVKTYEQLSERIFYQLDKMLVVKAEATPKDLYMSQLQEAV